MRCFLLLALAACTSSSLDASEVDNPDAFEPIPPPPPVDDRDQGDDPYDDPADDDAADDPVDDPQDDPVDDPQDDPSDPPADDPVDPPDDDPVDPPDDDPVDPPGNCPTGVICVDTFPFVDTNTTTGSPSVLDGYGCDPSIDESGPEVVYQIELTEPGFLAVTLSGMTGDVDVDAHLLETTDPTTCIDRGHWDAASLLEPGIYTVVVDSWVNSSGTVFDGDYTVRFQHTRYADFAGDGLGTVPMQRALTAFDTAWQLGETSKLIYTIADFDLPSTQPRLWTIDLATGDLLFNELVSHGEASSDPGNPAMVAAMSNINGSHQSSVGLMRAAETYYGSKGYSMRLDGLEAGFNDAVRPRAIVFHGATYATQSFVDSYGYLGRSWGCPAVDPAINDQLIDTIKNGSLFFSHFSDPSWVSTSGYLE